MKCYDFNVQKSHSKQTKKSFIYIQIVWKIELSETRLNCHGLFSNDIQSNTTKHNYFCLACYKVSTTRLDRLASSSVSVNNNCPQKACDKVKLPLMEISEIWYMYAV